MILNDVTITMALPVTFTTALLVLVGLKGQPLKQTKCLLLTK